MSRRGMTLGSVLMVVALLATLGMALAGGAISHHQLLQNSDQRESARNLARSAVNLAFERLLRDTKLGTTGHAVQKVEVVLDGEFSDSSGILVFDPQQAGQLGVPVSLNNLEKPQSSLDGRGQTVPPNAVRLVGVGRCRGVEQVVEATLVVPPFPWALAAGGNLRGEEGLEVGAVAGTPTSWEDLELLPADLMANQDIFLGPNSTIEGDVQAAGGIEFSAANPQSIQVKGRIRPGQRPTRIPDLDVTTFDPQNRGMAATTLNQTDWNSADPLRGAYRRQGPLVVHGDLDLKGGMLYVDGDLTIDGGVLGKGLVVATGRVQVAGSSQLEGSNAVAMLSGGDMSLRGRGKNRSSLAGLVYSNGKFNAESISVLGTLVARQDATFKDARMVSMPAGGGAGPNRKDIPLAGLAGGSPVTLIPRYQRIPTRYDMDGTQIDGAGATITYDQLTTYDKYVLSVIRLPGDPNQLILRMYRKRTIAMRSAAADPFPVDPSGSLDDYELLSEASVPNDANAISDYLRSLPAGLQLDSNLVEIPPLSGEDDRTPPTDGDFLPTLDLSSVISLEERIRLCQWKEL